MSLARTTIVGFAQSVHRMNVALTRARRHLIIVYVLILVAIMGIQKLTRLTVQGSRCHVYR